MRLRIVRVVIIVFLLVQNLYADDGYRLWMRYDRIADQTRLKEYQSLAQAWLVENESPTLLIAKKEFTSAIQGLLGTTPAFTSGIQKQGTVIALSSKSPLIASLKIEDKLKSLGDEGYYIFSTAIQGKKCTVITGNSDIAVLYGTHHFIRLLQTLQSAEKLAVASAPRIKHRLLNHWDNLDRTVERGYAGFSLWDWHKLPDYIDTRYYDYARANASIGINGTVLTNVNANAQILTEPYLKKVAALANIFRPYGIKVYLTARFSAPVEIGKLPTADPLDPAVKNWWKEKVDEIYKHIPDFGGFVVKANSEGQPGPQNYKRNHADGANMLAEALETHPGIVMWRAFVYSNEVPTDRVKQAYDEFKPLDGTFRKNVMVQVKNGPLDFQPREPFHPLFGAMPQTPIIMEFQITQEYMGQATNLFYQAPYYKECLESDTYAKGKGSTVATVIDGTLENHALTGICGVANIGNDRNWTGHPFGQANWYCFGRLAWDHQLSSEAIADEWIRSTLTNDQPAIATIKSMMIASREIVAEYMTPLGLHHIMGEGHHYGPAPWVKDAGRADWTSVYYHKADINGIGFDRSSSGTNAVEQYFPPVREIYNSLEKCPERYLLWFHHVSWDHKMKSGRTLWDELCYKYYHGADSVKWMQKQWESVKNNVDAEIFQQTRSLLNIQQQEATWWRNACILYFQSISKRELPAGFEKPDKTLEYYQSLRFPSAPGIRPRW